MELNDTTCEPVNTMELFIGVKIIKAEKSRKPFSESQLKAMKPGDDTPEIPMGYAVMYSDAEGNFDDPYISWSPTDVFEAAYRRCDAMPFAHAIEAMKQGKKVARAGWNGKGVFIYLVGGSKVERCKLRAEANMHYPSIESGVTAEDKVTICPHIDMKAAGGNDVGPIVVGWIASQTDMLAEDWQIVD